MHRLFLALLLVAGLVMPAQAEVDNIDNQQLKALMEQGVPIIDIRRPEEWKQTGVVKGSHLITFFDARGRYDVQAWLDRLAPIAGKDDPFVLICRTGTVSRFLDQKLGYKKVYNVQKGITDWIRKGNPVVEPEL